MYKELFSTQRAGLIIDTNDWLIGISVVRNLRDSGDGGTLLEIGFLCLRLLVAF